MAGVITIIEGLAPFEDLCIRTGLLASREYSQTSQERAIIVLEVLGTTTSKAMAEQGTGDLNLLFAPFFDRNVSSFEVLEFRGTGALPQKLTLIAALYMQQPWV